MLQNIHDKAKGWVAYAIVGFIAIPFTLFGISSYLSGGGALIAASVNGEEIPVQLVQNAVLRQRQQLTQMFGGKLPPNYAGDAIKSQALEQAVNEVLIRQEAESNGYRASNQEVYDTISEIPSFQKNGVFDVKTYEQLLASQRRTKAGFETEIRQSITNQQYLVALNQAAFLPSTEVAQYERLQNQTRNVETYTLKTSEFESDVIIKEDEVKTYYDTNASKFMTPEKLKLTYIELKKSDLEAQVDVKDDDLQLFYDDTANIYRSPEQRKLSHILVKLNTKEYGSKAEKKAEERAKALYEQIQSGLKTFEELAKTDSDDTFTAEKSGELGLIAQGDMGPLFSAVAFSLEKGALSAPTKTEAGFEIIKLTDIVESVQKPFSDVKNEVEKAFRTEQAEKLFFDASDKMQTLAFEDESTLDTVADAIGVTLKTSDWIEKDVISAGQSSLSTPKVLAAAFSDDVLNGKNSELLEINPTTVMLIRLQERKLPEQMTLTEVTEKIKDILKRQKVRKIVAEKGDIVLAKLIETADWSALTEVGASANKVKKIEALSRTDRTLSVPLVAKLFSMEKPQDGKKTFDHLILNNGDYVLNALLSVKEGDADENSPEKSGFIRIVSSREQQALLMSLREKSEIKLFPENIQ